MTNNNQSKMALKKDKFTRASSLRAALNCVGNTMFHHGMYQHYTTLENVLKKIATGEWWLSCCTSDRLNDQNEAAKYGSEKEARTMYQTCFCHGAAESVAMWGLYQQGKPCAVRITLSKKCLRKWVKALRADVKGKYVRVSFRDLLYLSVADPDRESDAYDIERTNCVSWDDVKTQKVENLQAEIVEDWATGLVKDREWRHERESRLLVKMQKNKGLGIKVPIPDDVLEEMHFTFSPWLSPNMEPMFEKQIMDALTSKLKKAPKKIRQRFRRSVLAGGLKLGDGRIPCAYCDSCKLFGRKG